MFIKYYLLQ